MAFSGEYGTLVRDYNGELVYVFPACDEESSSSSSSSSSEEFWTECPDPECSQTAVTIYFEPGNNPEICYTLWCPDEEGGACDGTECGSAGYAHGELCAGQGWSIPYYDVPTDYTSCLCCCHCWN